MAKHNNKGHILFRYGLISLTFFIFAAAVVAKLISTTIFDAPKWNERATEELNKVDTIAPVRGIIFADNGAILACNVRVFDVRLDLGHRKILENKKIKSADIDALADSLDKYYPRVPELANYKQGTDSFTKYSWRTRLAAEFAKPASKRNRSLRLVRAGEMADFDRVKGFPILKDIQGKGFHHPLHVTGYNKRIYPFGQMAKLSIGRVCQTAESKEIHGYSGLEYALDPMLYGTPGYAKRIPLTKGLTSWMTHPKSDGYDILSTINIDLQDIVEEELMSVCMEQEAEWGTAILMEVSTGEIKALSNIERLDDGTYGESMNHAVLPYEPGSVVKTISLMIAFEDGLVKSVNDVVDCSPFQRTSDPHAPTVKTMKQVLERSSNTGIARVIFRGYGQNPEKWHDRLASIGFFDDLNTGIRPMYKPNVRRLTDTDSRGGRVTLEARHLDLARQAFGYNTAIPPLLTLSYYNAIANDGKYMVPHLVKGVRLADGRDSMLNHKGRVERVCSEQTAAKMRECIREVVWGSAGTARAVQDDRVEIAGKTGTAFPHVKGLGYDKSKRRFAFAGFFPYDKPRYSCMVVMQRGAGCSAARSSGLVLKNVALKMFARGMLNDTPSFVEGRVASQPTLHASTAPVTQKFLDNLGATKASRISTSPAPAKGLMPDMRGYDAPSAIAILEKMRLNVRIQGAGRVTEQSIPAGTKIRPGATILLKLKV